MTGPSRADDLGDRSDELRLLALLVRAGERMDDASDLEELWPIVAAEAALVLGASAKVMQWTSEHWVLLHEHLVASQEGEAAPATAATAESFALDDDTMADARALAESELVTGHVRSVLVTNLECSELRVPTRLVWTSPQPEAFVASSALAAEYTRFASSAVRRTQARVHLQRAITARHRVGQAQGIVMARLELGAADAFEVLLRRSQNTNVKLAILADHLIRVSELEAAGGVARQESIDVSQRGELDDAGLGVEQEGQSPPAALRAVADPDPDTRAITTELCDALGEAVISGTGDAAARAEVMCAVVAEMRASVEWLNGNGSTAELRSLESAVAAMHEHLHRMLRLPAAVTS